MNKLEILKTYFGHDSFRSGQEELVDGLISGRDVLGVMPTGAGKSVCYQVPAMAMEGITLVISPLISLMKDQVTALKSAGIPAAFLNSSLSPAQMDLAMNRAMQGAYKVIYVAPERLETNSFLWFAQHVKVSLIAVDEAHCVSQWGQDFRPNYLKIADFVDQLPQRPVIGAFTATATQRVREDIVRYLRLQTPVTLTTGFDRPNLFFEVRKPKDKYQALCGLLRGERGKSGIIYCSTRKNVEEVTDKLQADGYAAARYHAGLSEGERAAAQEDFQYDRVQIMVATNAFGMGIDKSNVSFVIHYNMPHSMEAYYQEAGRAGRDGSDARCTLLYSPQDVVIGRWMIQNGTPNPELTDEERKKIRSQDLSRLRMMAGYATSTGCLREQILKYFGQRGTGPCGSCGGCRGTAAKDREPYLGSDAARAPSAFAGGSVEHARSFDSYWEAPAPLPMKPKKVEQPEEEKPVSADDLFGQLRACRMKLSKTIRIPPYLICEDKTLTDMVSKMPKTPDELLQVHGMGINKVGKYGDAFLKVIRNFAATHSNDRQAPAKAGTNWSKEQLDMMQRGYRAGVNVSQLAAMFEAPENEIRAVLAPIKAIVQKKSTSLGNKGALWTPEEDEQLRKEFASGMRVAEMMRVHRRNRGGITSRLKKLNLAEENTDFE